MRIMPFSESCCGPRGSSSSQHPEPLDQQAEPADDADQTDHLDEDREPSLVEDISPVVMAVQEERHRTTDLTQRDGVDPEQFCRIAPAEVRLARDDHGDAVTH